MGDFYLRSHDILKEIEKLFAANEPEAERQQLEDEISAGFTGGELCLRTGSKLLTLQNKKNRLLLQLATI